MKEIMNISVGSKIAEVKQVKDVKVGESSDGKSSKDFLSVMFSQIKNSIKAAKSETANIEDALLKNETPTTQILNEKAPKKSLDEHLLSEVLEVISLLKNETPKTSFPKYSTKIEKLLSDEVAIKEFKDVKNIADLMNLSKKYDLGLEKLSIKKVDFESIKQEFPTLDKKAFFEIPKESEKVVKNTFLDKSKLSEIKSSEIPLSAIQKPVKKTEKEPSIFEKIITKEVKKEENSIGVKTTPKENLHVKEEKIILKKDNQIKQDVKKDIEIKQDVKKDIEVKQDVKKDIEIKSVEKEIKNIKEVPKEFVATIKEKKDEIKTEPKEKKILSEDIQEELPIKEAPKMTRTSEIKVEPNIEKKGFAEAILQGLKAESKEQAKNVIAQNIQTNTSSEKVSTEAVQSESSEIKVDTNTALKNDVKVNLKQEINVKQAVTRETWSSFADDLRERIENYKPPIMKVQMALNPKSLGEVDVTIINRGNNLHVNITSNTNTMSLFTQNQAEFKNSLVNMGFTNLEMNFSDQRESNKEQGKNSNSSNNEFSEELLEDEQTSVELVVPQYV